MAACPGAIGAARAESPQDVRALVPNLAAPPPFAVFGRGEGRALGTPVMGGASPEPFLPQGEPRIMEGPCIIDEPVQP